MTDDSAPELLSEEWVGALVAASHGRTPVTGLDGVVAIKIGKTKSAVMEIVDGRVIGPSAKTVEVEVPFTKKQLEAWRAGEFEPGVAYMMGDLKPVGATGPLLAMLAVFDDPAVVQGMA